MGAMANQSGHRPPTRLGDLEAAIMRVVWDSGRATVHDVLAALAPTRTPAYTTVMTVMSRLAEKGVLMRQKVGRAYVYGPVDAQHEVAGSLLDQLVGRLYAGSAAGAIEHLIEADANVDDAELARLERLIRTKRKERGT